MRIYAVFGDNAVMIEYSYEHARYCLHKYFRGAHYTKAFGSIAEATAEATDHSVGNCPAEPGYTGVPQTPGRFTLPISFP